MKRIIFAVIIGIFLTLPSWALKTDIPKDHWAYKSLNQAASFEITCPWFENAAKEATRLNIAEIFSKYIKYLDKSGLINPKPAAIDEEYADIPEDSPYLGSIKRVVSQYKIMQTSSGNEFNIDLNMPIGQFAISLSKILSLSKDLNIDRAELVRITKRQFMSNFPDSAYKRNNSIKRYEVVAALVKAVEYLKEKKQALKTEEIVAPSNLKDNISFGGMMGHIYEKSSSTSSLSMFGGKMAYEHPFAKDSAVEVAGLGCTYDLQSITPMFPAGVKTQTVKESMLDAQVSYKNAIPFYVGGGKLSSLVGVRSFWLANEAAKSSLLGLRGGLEYLTKIQEKLDGKIRLGVTAKILGEQGSSIIGEPSSVVDYELGLAYSILPDAFLSLNYAGDALVFSRSFVRYFNTLTLKSGWKI
ncbi:MAG: hypothetical protein FD145_422 [Candidatus Saganbacteria bacterium]|uniref:Uncharacterized protein n=1 Tax=Candidatus Saganbacteria bacterium TaxID=2575572 RepID=A0A833L1Y4_UNCSA|nr:MAG: hypothetical protein FD145_422 [Candidatus Saganbacteria bacterium]